MTQKLADSLAYPPRALRLETAAAYLSISPSAFMRLVEQGDLPAATKKGGIALWDRLDLDAAFENWKATTETTFDKAMRELHEENEKRERTNRRRR